MFKVIGRLLRDNPVEHPPDKEGRQKRGGGKKRDFERADRHVQANYIYACNRIEKRNLAPQTAIDFQGLFALFARISCRKQKIHQPRHLQALADFTQGCVKHTLSKRHGDTDLDVYPTSRMYACKIKAARANLPLKCLRPIER